MILDDHSAPTPKSASASEAAAAATITGLPPGVEALGKKLLKIAPDRASPQAVAHLQKFVVFLKETLQDRSLAITHQRKTNQILGQKVCNFVILFVRLFARLSVYIYIICITYDYGNR